MRCPRVAGTAVTVRAAPPGARTRNAHAPAGAGNRCGNSTSNACHRAAGCSARFATRFASFEPSVREYGSMRARIVAAGVPLIASTSVPGANRPSADASRVTIMRPSSHAK